MSTRREVRRRVLIELDGPDVTPETVDTALMLELAAATFALLQANAKGAGLAIAMRGLEVQDKCVALGAHVARTGVVIDLAKKAMAQIDGSVDAPPGLQSLIERARAARRALASEQRASLIVGSWKRELRVEHESPPTEPLDSILSIRATPLRAGGVVPVVRFRSALEEEFGLRVSQDQARALGSLLYREVDLEARVARSADGLIVDGKLESFDLVQETDSETAWRDWYKSVGGDEWDKCLDIEAALH